MKSKLYPKQDMHQHGAIHPHDSIAVDSDMAEEDGTFLIIPIGLLALGFCMLRVASTRFAAQSYAGRSKWLEVSQNNPCTILQLLAGWGGW